MIAKQYLRPVSVEAPYGYYTTTLGALRAFVQKADAMGTPVEAPIHTRGEIEVEITWQPTE